MAIKSRSIALKRSTRLAKEGSFEAGAGKDDRLAIGILSSDSRRQRAYARLADNRFPATFWDGMFKVDRVELWGYKVSYYRTTEGGPGRVRVRRATAGQAEGTSPTLSSSNGGGAVWPGPATHAGSEVRGPAIPSGTGKWVKIADVTTPSKVWWPQSLGGTGSKVNGDDMLGLVLAQDGDDWSGSPGFTSTTDNVEFASDDWGDGSKRLELRVFYDDNRPPSTPTVTSPEPGSTDGVVVGTTAGTELSVEYTYADQDGDAIGAHELEVYPQSVTDETATTANRTATTGAVAPGDAIAFLKYRATIANLPARADLRYRLRVRDARGAWSGWTSLADGRFQTAHRPGAPLQSVMTTNPEAVTIAGTLNGPGTISGWEGEFYRDTQQGSVTLWAPGMQDIGGASTRSSVPWAGVQLNDGDVVRWRHRHRNEDGVVGDWSSWLTTTMRTPVGTTISPADTTTKLTTRTPTLTLTFPEASDAYRLLVRRNGEQIWDSGTVACTPGTSASAVIAAAAGLTWGDTFEVQAAGRPSGTSAAPGPFGPWTTLYITTLPTTSIAASDGDVAGSVVPTTDILWETPYLDPDAVRYGETPAAKELELRVAASPPGSGTRITKRTSVSRILEAERTGRRILALTDATGWSAASNVTADTEAIAPTGYSGNSLRIRATGGSSTDRAATYTFPTPLDLSDLGDGAVLRIWVRCTSTTNLTRWDLRLRTDSGNLVLYELFAAAGTPDTWVEIAVPLGKTTSGSGTVDWSSIASIQFMADVSGAYTGDLQVRDLRIGTVRTAKDTPDGHIASEAFYDTRARFRDNADGKMLTTLAAAVSAGATNVKVNNVVGMSVGDELTIGTTHPIETRRITAVGTSGSGGTGVTVAEAFDFNHDSGKNVRIWYWGPWTPWLTVKASLPPEVAADTPADAAVLADPTPALAHTYSSPGSKAQALRTTRLYRRLGFAKRVAAMAPASWWRLGEASGSVLDSAGSIAGTAGGTITRATAGAFGALDADGSITLGSDGYIQFGDVHDFGGTDPFTAAILIKPSTPFQVGDRIWSKEGTGSGWAVRLTGTSGAVRFERFDGAGSDFIASTDLLVADAWNLVIAKYDGSTLRLTINGGTAVSGASARSNPGNTGQLRIGANSVGGSYLSCPVDEGIIWTRSITAAEEAALWAAITETPTEELVDERDASGAGLTDTVVRLLLADGGTYGWEKTAYDTDGLADTTARRWFLADLTAPAAVADLVATADAASGAITITWTASVDPYLDHYRVYWRNGAGERIRIDGGPAEVDDGREPLTEATFTWYGGRLGDNDLEVTVHNGSQESEPTTVSVSLDPIRAGAWALVGDDEDRYTFAFDPTRAPRVHNPHIETMRPPGRRRPVHLLWGTSGKRVSVTFAYLPSEDGDLATIVGELLERGVATWLKAPEGYVQDPLRVRTVDARDEPETGGWVSVSIELDEVAIDV
jgi:hypothetical protein